MNLGVSGESGLASKQIRGKISVGRRRRKDGTKTTRDGRQTDGLSFGKDLRRNHRCAKPFRPSSWFHTGNERRRRDCELERERDGGEAALTDSVADRLRRSWVTRGGFQIGNAWTTFQDGCSLRAQLCVELARSLRKFAITRRDVSERTDCHVVAL